MESGADEFSLNLELFSEELKITETKTLKFSNVPSIIGEIRDKVEEEFSIAGCSQTVWIQGRIIHESRNSELSSYYLKSGDTIKICYPVKCDCQNVKIATKWLRDSTAELETMKRSHSTEFLALFEKYISKMPDNLTCLKQFNTLFGSWTDKVKNMNCSYFEYLDGIDLLVKLHGVIISMESIPEFKLHAFDFEHIVCHILSVIARNRYFSKRITEAGGLDTCIFSFLTFMSNTDLDDYTDKVIVSLHAICK